MEYKVSAFKVIINGVNAYSWIIRSLVNNGCNPNALAELDYNTGVIAFDIYLADWDWLCELLDYTEEPDTTRDQLVEFYNKIRTEIPGSMVTRNIIKANGLNY